MQFLRRRLSDGNFLAGGKPPPSGPAPPLLLVVGPPDTDWVQLFKGKSVHGDVELRVEQAQFAQLSLVASTHGGLSVAIDGNRRFRPDFVLLREAPGGPDPGGAPQRLLAGLHMGGVPGTDPLPAARALGDPALTFAQLVKLQRELGPEAFPLVPQRFCTRPRGLLAAPTFPMNVTLSPAPAGVGQVRVGSQEALRLVAAAMGGKRAGALVTMTPEGTQRVRVTRIGGTDRALSWSVAAGDPPGAGPQLQPMAVSERHRAWLDACSRLFGGLEICGVEALRGPDGREHILQVLGSWLPLEGPGGAQDRARIVELVLGRMRAELPPPPQVISGTPPEQRPPPQGAAPLLIGPGQPRPPPQGQPRPSGGVASAGPAPARGPAQQPRPQTPPMVQQAPPTGGQPRPQAPPTSPQRRPQAPPTSPQPRPQAPPTSPQRGPQAPPTSQPRPQAPPTAAQLRPQAPPTAVQPRPPGAATSPQPRPQAPPTSQPRPQTPPTGVQPRPQAPPTAQPRPQAPPTSPQPRPQAPPTSPQLRPQAPPTGVQPRPPGAATSPQPRPQAPPTAQPRPQTPPTAQPRPQAPPTAQPRPQTPPTAQPRPQAPPTAQPRPQAPPTAQPRPQAPPTGVQPRPQAPPTSPQPRPSGPQAPPTTRQPRPQAPPLAPKPALTPKPGGAAQAPPSSAPSLRQSFASLFE